MSDWFEDELRARFAAVVVDVPVDVRSILAEGHAAKHRRLVWLLAGLGLLVVVLAGLLGVPSLRGAVMGLMQSRPAPVNPMGTPSVTTSPSPVFTPTPSTGSLEALPRITVNRAAADDPSTMIVTAEAAAGVQRFADDVADGNIDSIVEHCWMYAADDLRAKWSDRTNRVNALQWLSQPPLAAQGGYAWTDSPGSLDRNVGFAWRDVDSTYACPGPPEFTAAQAALNIQRLVDRHAGMPAHPTDTNTKYPLACTPDNDSCFEDWASWTLRDDQTVKNGIGDGQWALLADMAGKPLSFVPPSTVGLPDHLYVATANPGGNTYAVFADWEVAGVLLMAVFEWDPQPSTAPTTPNTSTPAGDKFAKITVNSSFSNQTDILTPERLARIQRFADDLANADLDSIVANCWTLAADDVRAWWSDANARRQALEWLSKPAYVELGSYTWRGDGTKGPGLTFMWVPLDNTTYACPNPLEFTAAQAALDIQRLMARHTGTAAYGDTDPIYPLSCSPDPGFCAGAWTEMTGHLSDSQTVMNGVSATQWSILGDMAGKSLTLVDPTTVGLPRGFYVVTPDPASKEWLVFHDVNAAGILVVAIYRT